MPTYEYECKKCAHTFEVFQGMNDEPVRLCPECGGDVRRLINGGAAVIFHGSGFYSTDNASPSTSPKGGKGKAEGSSCSGCPHADGPAPCPEKAAG